MQLFARRRLHNARRRPVPLHLLAWIVTARQIPPHPHPNHRWLATLTLCCNLFVSSCPLRHLHHFC